MAPGGISPARVCSVSYGLTCSQGIHVTYTTWRPSTRKMKEYVAPSPVINMGLDLYKDAGRASSTLCTDEAKARTTHLFQEINRHFLQNASGGVQKVMLCHLHVVQLRHDRPPHSSEIVTRNTIAWASGSILYSAGRAIPRYGVMSMAG